MNNETRVNAFVVIQSHGRERNAILKLFLYDMVPALRMCRFERDPNCAAVTSVYSFNQILQPPRRYSDKHGNIAGGGEQSKIRHKQLLECLCDMYGISDMKLQNTGGVKTHRCVTHMYRYITQS